MFKTSDLRNCADTYFHHEVVYKVAGKLWSYKQDHTPFDVVAWHGKSVIYPYSIPLSLCTQTTDLSYQLCPI